MSKRIQCIAIMCIVISISLCPFFSVSAIISELLPRAYTSAYMPVCSLYPTRNQLPFGDSTCCVYIRYPNASSYTKVDYFFFTSTQYTTIAMAESGDKGIAYSNSTETLGFFLGYDSNQNWTANFQSGSKVIRVTQLSYTSGSVTTSTSEYGTWTDNSQTSGNPRYYNSGFFTANISLNDVGLKTHTVSEIPYCWNGFSAEQNIESGVFGSVNDFVTPYYTARYPDTVQQAITSIQDNNALLTQYYTSLNSRLNSLSIDLQYVQGQNDELSSKVDELQSQLGAQSGEYQSALNQAQSEIQSNANSAAQSAADDVNNAGSDVDDLDDNMDDVNGIVETLEGWIEDLDDFADRIDDSIDSVSVALTNANAVINGFFGACPPIVLALFGFALVFLVVRKIIGR